MLRFEIFPKCRFVDLLVDGNERNERSFSERVQRSSTKRNGTARRSRPDSCPPMPVSAYWPNENERGWYDARMFELYEDTACVEYADYPGKKHEIPRSWIRVTRNSKAIPRGIEIDDTEMMKDAAVYRSIRDAEVDKRDAGVSRLHEGIDTEMLKDAYAFRVHQGIEIDDDEIENKDIIRDASTFRLHQGIEVDTEMFKDAAAYRLSHNTEVENREHGEIREIRENRDDTKTVEETTITEINKDKTKTVEETTITEINKDKTKEKEQKNNKKKKRRKKKKGSPVECLVKAAKYGRFRSVAHWLEQGADVNGRELRHGYTALHWAAWKGYSKIMDLLLKNGADPRITNHRGETVLDAAKLSEQQDAYKLLLTYID